MLSTLIWLPIFGAILIAFLPSSQGSLYQKVAGTFVGITLLETLWMGYKFDITTLTPQFVEHSSWLESLGLSYTLGVDGLSFLLIILNALLTLIAIFISDSAVNRPRFYYALLLILNGSVAGTFLAGNLLLFFLFYEIELIPLYLLIAIWGGTRRGYAATKFLIYTAFSGILILAAFLGLAWLSGTSSFDYDPQIAQSLDLVPQLILLGGLLIGFGIKIPLFPFHTWLPDAHVEASTPVSVLLAGVLLKLGTYGLLRFGLGLFPTAWAYLAPILATWAVVSSLYGALLAIAQTDMKKMVAYSSIAHMGYILLAAAAATPVSLVAAVLQMVSHGLISGLLFLLVGIVYTKTKTRDINLLRGLLNPERGLPFAGTLMVLGVMASAGIPGMVGFIAEFLVFRGSFLLFPIQTLLCLVSTGLTAVYFLLLVNRAFFGRLATLAHQVDELQDVRIPTETWFDKVPSLVLAGLIILFGLQPSWLTHWTTFQLTIIN